MKFCILDAGQFVEKPELLDPLRALGDIDIYSGMPESAAEVARRAGEAEVVAFAVTQLTREMVDAMPRLKVLQFMGTGMWNFVDVEYAQSKGIQVLNIEAYGSNAVAEFAVCLTAALVRNVVPAVNILKDGGWSTDGLNGREIAGSTVGVVGTGAIGRLVVEKFIGLGAHVIANDIFESDYLKEKYGIEYVSLEEIFRRSDIVSLHMKVTKENEKIIDKKYLSLMKKDALFINVARAELVNIEDLYDALANRRIGAAAIDVFTSEPPGELEQKLVALPNVIGTPHIGFYTEQSNDNSIRMSVSSIIKALEG